MFLSLGSNDWELILASSIELKNLPDADANFISSLNLDLRMAVIRISL